MTVEEIPYFIMEHSENKHLRVLCPFSKLPILKVENGVFSYCCEEEYLEEVLNTLVQLQSNKSRDFKPLC
jgi:hypothetical protein